MRGRWPFAVAAGVCALALQAPAAGADIRTGTASDPAGDSGGQPSLDIISTTVSYDTTLGRITASVTMGADVAPGPASYVSFTVASFKAPQSCEGQKAGLYGFSDMPQARWALIGADGTGTGNGDAVTSVSGRTIVVTAQDDRLANKPWSCFFVIVSRRSDSFRVVDGQDVVGYFNGYGPDKDKDGVADNVDQCPVSAGPAPTGCADAPQAQVPVTPACAPGNLKGKSLGAAKSQLKRRHCRLGRVTRPKHPRHGRKLVVVGQRRSGRTVALTLGYARKRLGFRA